MARNYTVHSSGAGTIIRIEDETTPYLSFLAKNFPREMGRGLRHIGFWLQGELKAHVQKGGTYEKLSGIRAKSLIARYKAAHRGGEPPKPFSRKYPFGPRMKQAIGYNHSHEKLQVQVGWLSKSSARFGRMHGEHGSQAVTPRMRNMLFAIAKQMKKEGKSGYAKLMGLASNSTIERPARPVMKPVFKAKQKEIQLRLEKRIRMYLDEAATRAKRHRITKGRAA